MPGADSQSGHFGGRGEPSAGASLFASEVEAAAPGVYVRVAVERGIDRLPTSGDGSLTYRVMPPEVRPVAGQRVEVPLGKAGTATQGIIVEVGDASLADKMDASRVRSITRLRDEVIPADILALARWMAGYYVCPLGMVLAGMLPAAVKRGTGRKRVEMATLVSTTLAEDTKLRPAARRAHDALCERVATGDSGPWPLRTLAQLLDLASLAPLRKLAEIGLITVTETSEVVTRGEAASGSAGSVGTCSDAGLQLMHSQQHAIAAILDAPESGIRPFRVHLLRGVTGSGKTEVYLQVIARVLREGLSALVLVPEIALTPQTAERFTRRFGEEVVAVMHSGLTASQRHKAWARAAAGEARVVVGARSAVFAPVQRLGLVVVDEEHDSSYKQDRLPRYHGRDAAVKRAQIAGCPVVLGSATPSLESWHNATVPVSAGLPPRYSLHELPTRVPGASMPVVRIVDLARERAIRAHREGLEDRRIHLIGPTLEQAIEATLNAGGQIILLLNRRGFAHYISCARTSCEFILSCDQCDARLVLHKHQGLPMGGLVRCHHCLAEQRVPRLCPICRGRVGFFGGGTQRAEDEIVRKFGSLGIADGSTLLRLDSDTMKTSRDYHDALARFSRGDVRILLGTQMIAKGLDVPNVRLVGVLDADTALSIPDFRANERTFQLVSQVAGRAGRGGHTGHVIIQTYHPTHDAIVLAAAHDYATFARAELATRYRASLPPVRRMARIVCRDADLQKATNAARDIVQAFREVGDPTLDVRNPIPCAVARIAGQHRIGIDAFSPSAGQLQRALAHARSRGLIRSDAKTAIDIDPVALM